MSTTTKKTDMVRHIYNHCYAGYISRSIMVKAGPGQKKVKKHEKLSKK
jgi:hypothetical protein